VYAGLGTGDGVIVDSQTAYYFGLNRTAAFLWERLQGGQATQRQLVSALLERFEVDDAQATRDVQEFLRHVLEYGLIRQVAG
jgi:hypothetical protein